MESLVAFVQKQLEVALKEFTSTEELNNNISVSRFCD